MSAKAGGGRAFAYRNVKMHCLRQRTIWLYNKAINRQAAKEEMKMLGDAIKMLRKRKGYSQETFAQQLDVVRQTVSKWEKGYSVPDAEMLRRISDVLEVPVSVLLSADARETETGDVTGEKEIARQLAVLNEQLADRSVKRKRMIKRIVIGVVVAVVTIVAVLAISISFYNFIPEQEETSTLEAAQNQGTLTPEASDDYVVFQGNVYEKIDLSPETIEWLTWYNSLTAEEQLSVDAIPAELQDPDRD